LLPREEEIIDEDWREDVELCGFWFIQSPSMMPRCYDIKVMEWM